MKSADGRFEYRDQQDNPLPPGTPADQVHRFAFRCRWPGCDNWCSLNLRGRGHDVQTRSWTWDGNVDRPTLAPSVNCRGDECWHGFIEGGEFRNTKHEPEAKQ